MALLPFDPHQPHRAYYTDHAVERSVQRWAGSGAKTPSEHRFNPHRVIRLSNALAARFGFPPKKGTHVVVSRDALAVMAGVSVITVQRVDPAVIDDVRATMLCRAMGLGVEYGEIGARERNHVKPYRQQGRAARSV
jgi:hypothetical protein